MIPHRSDALRAPLHAFLGVFLILALLCAPYGPVQAQDATSGATEPLVIAARTGRHVFAVEVMRTDAERSRGLMFRRTMAADHGMLFDFETTAPVAMWMKNTYLPLDMLFIRNDGSIARIATDTEPLSTKVIPSGEPVSSVLELNAGTADRLGLHAGDRVEHPLFKPRGR